MAILLGVTAIALAISVIWGIVYRLFLSPIAHFPGPKLAALTFWYEFYYDAVLKGRYAFRIKEMHEKYGPIVRINPHELHIADADFYSVLYTQHPPRDKHVSYLAPFAFPQSSFSTVHHGLHRLRRGAMNPFFARGRILKQEGLIKELLQQLCGRVKEMANSNTIVPLSLAYTCFTTDLINSFIMDRNFHYLDAPDLLPYWSKTLKDASELTTVTRQITWVLPLLRALPLSWIQSNNPGLGMFYTLAQRSRDRIGEIKGEKEPDNPAEERKHTLIDEILNSKLGPEEKTAERLEEEIRSAIGAGTETTSNALTVITYQLLQNSDMLQRLQKELREMVPDSDMEMSSVRLEKLPYLSSVVLEGLRLSYGVSTRLQRKIGEPLKLGQYVIPAGTIVGMSSIIQHHLENVFPDSYKFNPERWLPMEERKHLEKYMVSFSKGSRRCIGMNLAMAEIYLVIATLFRKFDFELYGTTDDDIKPHHEVFIPRPKNRDSVGVRVKAKEQQ